MGLPATASRTPCRGEIWWVALDPTLGSEIRKTRPCLVVRVPVRCVSLDRFRQRAGKVDSAVLREVAAALALCLELGLAGP